jgi:hypothetical protein
MISEAAFRDDVSNKVAKQLYRDPSFYIATSALLLFLAVFALQVIGLKKAVEGQRVEVLQVRWCSPFFQPFGLVV